MITRTTTTRLGVLLLAALSYCAARPRDAQAQAVAAPTAPAAQSGASASAPASGSASASVAVDTASATPTQGEPGLAELRAQLESMRKELAAQREELNRQRAQIEAGVPPAAAPDSAQQQAELAALSAAAQAPLEAQATDPLLRVYGFADTGLQRAWGSLYDTGLSLSNATNFVLGNVNLYFDAKPDERWRALVEMRLTLFPNGTETLDPKTNTFVQHDTTIYDYTSPFGGFTSVRWSALILERAHIDFTPHDAFNVRVGYFLTPYGIWNVDHGSPTRIMLNAPFFVLLELFPERQTGIDLFGRVPLLPWELGYHLYVSNGRDLGGIDYTDDKSVGARVYVSTRRPIGVQLGASFFHGSSQRRSKSIGATAAGTLGVVRTVDVDQTETAGAADVSLDVGPLRFRAEYVANLIRYNNGKRALLGGVPLADSLNMDAYAMVAYRLPWLGLEPLVVGEAVRYPTLQLGGGFLIGSAGVNVYITQSTTIRTLYSYARSESFGLHGPERDYFFHSLASRLVIAF